MTSQERQRLPSLVLTEIRVDNGGVLAFRATEDWQPYVTAVVASGSVAQGTAAPDRGGVTERKTGVKHAE